MELNEKQLESKTIFTGKVLTLQLDSIELPNGKPAIREVVRHSGAVAVVPILPDGRVILVRQFRYPVNRQLLEIPAGKLDVGEAPDDCAVRELEEETGYRAGHLQFVTSILTTPGFSDEVIHIYIAKELKKVGQNLDADEFLNVEILPQEKLQTMLSNGEISDAKTIIGLSFLAGR